MRPRPIITHEDIPQLNATHVRDARSEPPVRGEALLTQLDMQFTRLNRWVKAVVPDALNPFTQMGAVADTMFIVAIISGILLLFWYKASVFQAYDSLEAMRHNWPAQLVRSIHRYSSDGCLLFVILHALQILGARKFGGVRWLAWVSGVALVWLLWVDGWTGYWLVWDVSAQQVALGTAKWLDVLPIFADPLSRSFLTDDSVNSLFFFVVFFIHMLLPLVMGVALWIHIMRLNDSHFLTNRKLTGILLTALVMVSLLFPALSAEQAAMQIAPQSFKMDWFYLLPLIVTDRLHGGGLWLVTVIFTVAFFSVPWAMARQRSAPAKVNPERCHGCTQCFQDCPFNAITMRPRDGKHPVVSYIDPDKCVGCGVCVGSCDPWAIEFDALRQMDVRKWIRQRLKIETADPRHVAFVCADSAGADLQLNAAGECAELTGYRIVPVPCVSWLFAPMIAQVLRAGVPGVMVVGCGPNEICRKGNRWTAERLAGTREPYLLMTPSAAADHDESDLVGRIRYIRYDRSQKAEFIADAQDFRAGKVTAPKVSARRWANVVVIFLILAGAIITLSRMPYRPPQLETAELVISFKHPGQLVEQVTASAADQQNILPHMRGGASKKRLRTAVRLQVFVDGAEKVNQTLAPRGLFSDGASIAIEKIPLLEGRHLVKVRVGDSANPDEWQFSDSRELDFKIATRRVVLFSKSAGFKWY